MRFRALRDWDHGAFSPQVDGLGPVQSLDTAALDGYDAFSLRSGGRKGRSATSFGLLY